MIGAPQKVVSITPVINLELMYLILNLFLLEYYTWFFLPLG